jgi:hypothetical protein
MLGEGEWKTKKHGAEYRRQWRKVHLGIDAETLEIRAIEVYPSGQVTLTAGTKRTPQFSKQATSDAVATPGSGWPGALAAVRAHP